MEDAVRAAFRGKLLELGGVPLAQQVAIVGVTESVVEARDIDLRGIDESDGRLGDGVASARLDDGPIAVGAELGADERRDGPGVVGHADAGHQEPAALGLFQDSKRADDVAVAALLIETPLPLIVAGLIGAHGGITEEQRDHDGHGRTLGEAQRRSPADKQHGRESQAGAGPGVHQIDVIREDGIGQQSHESGNE